MSELMNEAGGHRIQRIPSTERSGRVHTSTVTVAVLDELSSNPYTIPETDLSVSWFSGTGGGGQHRNKHQNSCRLKHIPTGITVTSQTRSRENSYKEAYSTLVSRLEELESQSSHLEFSSQKKIQVGSGMRGDKIRTIRFQDDQVADHRILKTIKAKDYMRGNMDLLW